MKKTTIPAVLGLEVEGLVSAKETIMNLKPRKTVIDDNINQLGKGYILQGNKQEDFGSQSFSVE